MGGLMVPPVQQFANVQAVPGVVVDKSLARHSGTTGRTIQGSVITCSDAGALAGVTSLTMTGPLGVNTTNPLGRITVKMDTHAWGDGIRLEDSDSTNYFETIYTSSNRWILGYNGSSKITVDGATGNVGISDTSPSYKLCVNGDIMVQDAFKRYHRDTTTYTTSLGPGYMDYVAATGHRFTGAVSLGTVTFTGTLNNVNTTEFSQLENIDSTTISATQWGYLGAMDQGVAQGNTVRFAAVGVNTDATLAKLQVERADVGNVIRAVQTGAVGGSTFHFENSNTGATGGTVFIRNKGTGYMLQADNNTGTVFSVNNSGSLTVAGVVTYGTNGTNTILRSPGQVTISANYDNDASFTNMSICTGTVGGDIRFGKCDTSGTYNGTLYFSILHGGNAQIEGAGKIQFGDSGQAISRPAAGIIQIEASSYARVGTAATSQGLGANGDLLVSGKIEVNGPAYFEDVLEVENLTTGVQKLLKLTYANAVASGGYISFDAGGATEVGRIQSVVDAGGEASLRFYDFHSASLQEVMRLNGGKVGINTTDPSSALDVAGNVEVGSANWYYWGAPNTNDSWRQGRSGSNLVTQRREGGVWVTKQTITP